MRFVVTTRKKRMKSVIQVALCLGTPRVVLETASCNPQLYAGINNCVGPSDLLSYKLAVHDGCYESSFSYLGFAFDNK